MARRAPWLPVLGPGPRAPSDFGVGGSGWQTAPYAQPEPGSRGVGNKKVAICGIFVFGPLNNAGSGEGGKVPSQRFDSERAKLAAKRSAEVRAERAKARREAKEKAGMPAAKPEVERDRALALRTARGIAKDSSARDADRLAAAALLARIEEADAVAQLPELEQLALLSEAELVALLPRG